MVLEEIGNFICSNNIVRNESPHLLEHDCLNIKMRVSVTKIRQAYVISRDSSLGFSSRNRSYAKLAKGVSSCFKARLKIFVRES